MSLGLKNNFKVIVNEDDNSLFDPIPEKVDYEFSDNGKRYEINYAGYSFEMITSKSQIGKSYLGHYLHYINPSKIDAEVLLKGKTAKDSDKIFDDETALIIRKGNLYFVNGGYLHLASSAILANIIAQDEGIGKIYNSPSYGYFTNGKDRAVFFAPYDVDIDLNILDREGKITEFDENSLVVEKSTVHFRNGRLKGKVKKFHLIVITP